MQKMSLKNLISDEGEDVFWIQVQHSWMYTEEHVGPGQVSVTDFFTQVVSCHLPVQS